jgi:hypothetical protein
MDPLPMASMDKSNGAWGWRALCAAFVLLAAGLLVYSQTMAFHWDEGFHILTAYLIDAGKRPYLDFFFPQTPLNAFWNAGWMAIFGPRWRAVHVVAALVTMGALLLIAQYVAGLFPDRRWQLAAAFAVLALFGLHSLVWEYGAISQAYPLCLLLVVAAFRIATLGVGRTRWGMSALAGILAGAAAASSLLTAAASPVLLIWIWLNNRAGNRWAKVVAFAAAATLPFAPVLFLLAHGPHQVVFDILKYHSIYRRLEWEGATGHDIGIVTHWLNSSPSLLLALLALAGLFFVKPMGFDEARRAEFRLCLWLAVAIATQNLFAHPTFPQYFVFLIPFLTVWGTIGFYAVARRLADGDRPWAAVTLLLTVAVLCLGNSLYEDRDSYKWRDLEQVAAKVKQVTPKDSPLVAPEQIYFLLHWPIPPGMEHDDAHKLQFSPVEDARLHVLPKADLDRQIKAGVYPTAVICDDDRSTEVEGWKVYSQKADYQDCNVFWQLEKHSQPKPGS